MQLHRNKLMKTVLLILILLTGGNWAIAQFANTYCPQGQCIANTK